MTSAESVSQAAKSIRRDVGHPTVLVNNAGIGFPGNVLSMGEDQVKKIFAVSTIACFILVKEFVPDMAANDHGHMVTIASTASFVTIAGNTEYSCTKAAAMAFNEGLRQDFVYRHNARHVRTRPVLTG